MPGIIARDRSIIPACDVATIEDLSLLVERTCGVEGIGGYKVDGPGSCVLSAGLRRSVEYIRLFTKLPIIYDHQKAGNDIPDMGENFS